MSVRAYCTLVLGLAVSALGWASDPGPRKDGDGSPLPPGALVRLGSLRFRHSDPVDGVAFSPDGAWAASYCASEGQVAVWHTSTGALRRRLPMTGVVKMALAGDGNLLAVLKSNGTFTGEILLEGWNLATGRRVFRVRDEERYAEDAVLAFSADGCHVYFGRSILRRVDVAGGRVHYRLAMGRDGKDAELITALAEAPDGATLVTAEGDGAVRLREPATGKERRRLEGVIASRLAFRADGSTLALATPDAFEIWQFPPVGKQVRGASISRRRISRGERSPVIGMAFSHDGRALLSLDVEGSACLWDVASGKPLVRRGLTAGAPAAVRFDAAHRPLVLTTDPSSPGLRVWNIARGEELLAQNDMGGQATCMAFSPDGATLVTGHEDKALRLWDTHTGQLRGKIRLRDCPCQVDFTPDGKSLIAGANGQWWRLLLGTHHGHRLEQPASLAPGDSASLASWRRGWKHRDRIVPWRIDGLEQCTLTRDGFLVDVQRNNLLVVEVASGKKLCHWQQNKYFAAALAPNRRTLAILRDETTVSLAEMADDEGFVGNDVVPAGKPAPALAPPPPPPGMIGMELATWEVPKTEMIPTQPWLFPSLAFAPGGRFAAVGTPRGSILIRDLATNEQVQQVTGHDSAVVMLAFSPDGRTMACAYRDTTVLIWDIAALTARPMPPGSADLEQCWRDLEKVEAPQAWKAHWALVSSKQTVSFLRARLQPVHRPDLSPLAQRVQELDSPRFVVRNRAMKVLENMGQAAEPALREALKKSTSLERQRRLEQLLAKIEDAHRRHLQEVRAIAVLEQIASDEAREVLKAVASGDPQAPLTIAAQAARKRMSRE